MVVQKTECIDGGPVWANDVYVATRERNPNWQLCNSWTSFKNFHPKQNNLPLPLIMPGPTPAIGQSAFKDFGVIFQDTITKSIETAKLLRHPNNPKLPWLKKQLLEKGQYPSVAELYTPNPDGLVDAYSFRQINKQIFTDAQNKDHELYTARLTSIPVRDKLSANNTVHEFIAKDRNNECDIKLHFLIGPATVNCCATTINSPLCLCPLSDTVQWEDYDISTGHPGYYSDTTSTGYYWPPTEDSVVTENFNVDTNSYIHIGRILSLSDSSMWKTFLTDSTKYVEVDLLLKDSATKQTIQSIENIKISGSNIFASFLSFLKPSNPCEPEYLSSPAPPTDEFLAYGTDRQIDKKVIVAPPSGKAYLTLSIKKSNNFPLVLAQSQIIQGELELNPKAPLPAQSLKKAVPISNKPSVASRIVLTIHPNPFKTKTDLELDVPNGTPLNITVFDILGHPLSVLVNEISTKDHYSISLESKLLNSGVYLIRVQAGNDVVSRKIEIIK